MGCSPSKGKIPFPLPESPELSNAVDVRAQHSVDFKDFTEETKTSNGKDNEVLLSNKDSARVVDISQIPPDTTTVQSQEGKNEYEVNVTLQEKEKQSDDIRMDTVKKIEKRGKTVGPAKKRRTERQKKASTAQTRVDLPPHMVRAHQAAYAYLIPNISKYESLLVLLNQAAQIHLSLQPMMTALLLRYEEINQALEEMAEEGDLMLKEHGDYMSWPSAMTGLAVLPMKPSCYKTNLSNPPPDLLQQLLQHSTEKMKVVGGSFQRLGDLTLEEAVEYFASLSKMLSERLHIKQVTEQRLAQVLGQVELAVVKKSNPEDSALHSEDSGIGGENESLPGSDGHRRHRGSAESGSCGSGGCVRAEMDIPPRNVSNQVGLNKGQDEQEEEEEEDEEDDEEGGDDSEIPGRKRSNSSPPDVSQLHPNHQPVQLPKRPLTASTSTSMYSPLSGDIDTLLKLQHSQKVLDRRMKNMSEVWGDRELPEDHSTFFRACLRRHSLGASGINRCAPKGSWKTNQTPCSLSTLTPQPPGCNSVRRLINTFSQGVDGRPGQSLANIPPHIKRPRRSGAILLPVIAKREGGFVADGNNNNNSWADSRDVDAESLPPPPPEVLMDNSFQSTEETHANPIQGCPVIKQKTGVSQQPRASIQNIMVLPNRASIRCRLTNITQDCAQAQEGHHTEAADADLETAKASSLYRQARKIIHLQNAAESPMKGSQAKEEGRCSSPLRAELCQGQGSTEADIPPSILPVMAPPVSRVRLPPSCPSVHHRFPSPPAFRPQPLLGGSRPPSRAGSPRPCSPRTWTRETSEEITPSVSFCDARSVFCKMEQQNSQTQTTSERSVLPRSWGEAARGRLPTRGTETLSRRTQSEQRASLPTHAKAPQGCRRASEDEGIKSTERPG